MQFIPVIIKLNFQKPHDHMIVQKSFKYDDLVLNNNVLLLSMLETVVLLNIFVETMMLLIILY